MIAVIDYGMGNIASVLNMFKRVEVKDVVFTGDPDEIAKADKILLPGVGSFARGMHNLQEQGLIEVLNSKVLTERVPTLGICLGMQLLTEHSEEGDVKGLGWVEGKTKKFAFDSSELKVPHMGWNYVHVQRKNALLTDQDRIRFYFVHSYYVTCTHQEDVLASADYGHTFTCAVQRENIWGMQFHPEKSHRFGMQVLESFAQL